MEKIAKAWNGPWSADGKQHLVGIYDGECLRDAHNDKEIKLLQEKDDALDAWLCQQDATSEIRDGLSGGKLLILSFKEARVTKEVMESVAAA